MFTPRITSWPFLVSFCMGVVVLVTKQFHASFVSLDHLGDFIKIIRLQMFHLFSIIVICGSLENQCISWMINFGLDCVVHNQFWNLFCNHWFWESKLGLGAFNRDGVILAASIYKIDFESGFLESLKKSFSKCSWFEVFHSFEDFDLTNVVKSFPPLTLVKLTGSKNNMVSAILRNKLHSLHVILLNEFSEVSADNLLWDIEFVDADVWNLKKKRCCHVHAVNYFKVDLKMWRNESLLLFSFFFKSLLLVLSIIACSLS